MNTPSVGIHDRKKRFFPELAAKAAVFRSLVEAARAEGPYVLDRFAIKFVTRHPLVPGSKKMPSSAEWGKELHGVLQCTWPCPTCEAFLGDVMRPLQKRLGDATPNTRDYHDGDPQFALAVFAVAIHSKPCHVVETGVARGVTSSAILHALRMNRHGHLHSIDLPPLTPGWAEQSRVAVSEDLRDRWTYVRGSSRRKLSNVLGIVGPIDVFIHDSLHTEDNMRYEFDLGWRALRPGGVLISDDIDDSPAFEIFAMARADASTVLLGQETDKARSRFGMVFKQTLPS